MFSEKLGTLILGLTQAERTKLSKFIKSTYFNEQLQLVQLYATLELVLVAGEESFTSLRKPELWVKTFPSLSYNDTQLRKWMHELTILILKFLSIAQLEKEPLTELKMLKLALDRPKLKKHQLSIEKQLSELLNNLSSWSSEHYLYAHELSFEQIVLGDATRLLEQIQETQHNLEAFYHARSLRIAIVKETFALTRASKSAEKSNFNAILTNDNPLLQIPLVHAYQLALLSFSNLDNKDQYQEFTQYIVDKESHIQSSDLASLYQIAINYCALKINEGVNEYFPALFKIYQKMADNRLILNKNELAEGMYKNIVTTALTVKEFDWIESFIRTQSQFLTAKVRENAMSFNLANVFYYQRRYDEALALIQRVEYSDIVYALGARFLLVRIYYEKDAIKPLESLLESFRVYLLRNKILSVNTKKEYLSLISFVGKLLKVRQDKTKLKQLKEKVLATQIKVPKRWLIERIDERIGS